jgi:hypothetical protein
MQLSYYASHTAAAGWIVKATGVLSTG